MRMLVRIVAFTLSSAVTVLPVSAEQHSSKIGTTKGQNPVAAQDFHRPRVKAGTNPVAAQDFHRPRGGTNPVAAQDFHNSRGATPQLRTVAPRTLAPQPMPKINNPR